MGYKRVEIRRGSLNQLSRFVVIKGKSDLLPLIKLQDGWLDAFQNRWQTADGSRQLL